MKVGIMSMQRIDNYGSFLQALGLKKMLEELGNEVIFVDYHPGPLLSVNKWKNVHPIIDIKFKLRPPVPYPPYKERDYIHRCYDALAIQENVYCYNTEVDTLVIGSDEVFNFIQNNPAVGFAPELLGKASKAGQIISYAASCGDLCMDTLQKYGKEKMMRKCLKKFSAISVRDKSTGELIEKLTGESPQYNLDPVLLADFGDFFEENEIKSDYILVYGYPHRFTEEDGKIIKKYAQKKGKRLISFCGKQDFCDEYCACTPKEILSYFKNADCIITDTFHGTIFSVLTHRPFITFVRKSCQQGFSNNRKVEDLIERLGVNSQKIERLTSVEQLEEILSEPIDFGRIDWLRKAERIKSMNYLSKWTIER